MDWGNVLIGFGCLLVLGSIILTIVVAANPPDDPKHFRHKNVYKRK